MENSSGPSDKDKQVAKLQEDFESIFTAFACGSERFAQHPEGIVGRQAVIAEQRGEISNLKRAIQTLENQILSDADMISD